MALSLSSTPSVDTKNMDIFQACERGDLNTLKQLIDHLSASVIASFHDEQGATLAHYAARYGHIHILDYFIQRKELNIGELRANNGATCLHDAAVCDQVQALDYILHYHERVDSDKRHFFKRLAWNVEDYQGRSPLHLAASYGSIKSLYHLLVNEPSDLCIKSHNGLQPIHYACLSAHFECVKLLLSFDGDLINQRTPTLLAPVLLASQSGSLEIIKLLSAAKANFQIKSENGLSCLHFACKNSHLNVVRWLVENQHFDVNDIDSMNQSPLHYAAANGNKEIIIYLLEKNARIIVSNNGNTPLHIAAMNGKTEACEVLMANAGFSVVLRNTSQLTPADLAEQAGFSQLAHLLRRRANVPLKEIGSSKLGSNIQLNNATVIRLVVKKGDIEQSDVNVQVNENEFMLFSGQNAFNNVSTTSNLVNRRFNLSELQSRVEQREGNRRDLHKNGYDVDDVLMHSLDSLNRRNITQPRAKLPTQTYAPWLKLTNMSSERFEQEIK